MEQPTSQYLRGLALDASGFLQEATTTYLNVSKVDSSSLAVKSRLARVYLPQKNGREALADAEQVVKAQPTSAEAHLLFAESLLQAGQLRRAEEELVPLSKAAPASPDVQVWLGMLYEAKRETGRARQAYQKAFDLQPSTLGALAGLVSVDISEKKPAAAISPIESELAKKPGDLTLLTLHAMALLTTGDLANAETAYQKGIAASPDSIDE